MSQFNLENAISDATRHDAPVQRGPMMRWQRKALESGVRSASMESSLNSSRTTSTKTPKARTPGLSPSRLGMNNKTPGKTPNKLGKTPNKSASNTPHRGADRFIPNRSAMDIDLSHFALMNIENHEQTGENGEPISPSKRNYQRKMSEVLNGNLPQDAKILTFKQKAPEASAGHMNNLKVLYSATSQSSTKSGPSITRQIPQQPERILDAPELLDDYYLNLLSWSSTNLVAIALGMGVYIWNASTGAISQLTELDSNEQDEYVTSLSWIKEGNILAVGNSLGAVQLWDVQAGKILRTMEGHASRVGSLCWNSYILSSGSRSGAIHHHDVRDANHHVGTLTGHSQEVCGLAWSPDGRFLASGANDNLLQLWDANLSHNNPSPLHTLSDHQAAVKALAWCPWQSSVLASGGGTADRTIRLWNTNTGNCLKTVDTKSQVSSLLWCPHYKELISGHGFAQFQLTIWKYPAMTHVTDLTSHTARILALAMSPDSTTVASIGADETLRLWKCFAQDKPRGKSATGGAREKSSCIALTKGLR